MTRAKQLIVLDIDNTVFDWVSYYVVAMEALLEKVASLIATEPAILAKEAQKIFTEQCSIEYPFLIQEMPSVIDHYRDDMDRLLMEAVAEGRHAFKNAALPYLQPYPKVKSTLANIRRQWANIPIIALTDAPRYVAMWKLNKLGLLTYFDAVYGLPDPRIPIDPYSKRVKVDQDILLKHLQREDFNYKGRIRTLPEDYEKPGTKGLKTVLMDFEMEDHRHDVIWVGDNLRKDVGLGKRLGIHTAWARYGTIIAPETKDRLLAFSPKSNVDKNVALDPAAIDAPLPDIVLDDFADLFDELPRFFPKN